METNGIAIFTGKFKIPFAHAGAIVAKRFPGRDDLAPGEMLKACLDGRAYGSVPLIAGTEGIRADRFVVFAVLGK